MRQWIIALVVGLVISGCSTLQVQTDYDQEFNFNSLSKFNVIYTEKKDGKDFTRSRISKILSRYLQGKGYTSTDKEQADFYVTLHLDIQKKSEIETNYETMGIQPRIGYYGRPYMQGAMHPPRGVYPYGSSFDIQTTRVTTRTYDYEEGRLVVEVIDIKSNAVIWQGVAEDELSDLSTEKEKSAYINKVIEKLFGDFPSRK